jgi:hypothetical protein
VTVEALGRAVAVYRRTADSRALIALVAANAIPLIGVLFLDWSLWTILVIYWLENGIVGFWNVPRMLLAGGQLVPEADLQRARAAADTPLRNDTPDRRLAQAQIQFALRLGRNGLPGVARLGLAGFFVVHYGIFWVVHGVFVFALPAFAGDFGGGAFTPGDGIPNSGPPGVAGAAGSAFGEILWGSVLLAAIALFVSHGASFLFNYVGRGEYRRTSPAAQMAAPYTRVVALHLAILFGAFAVALVGAPVAALVILVLVKTFFDLALHLREHRVRRPPATASLAAPSS